MSFLDRVSRAATILRGGPVSDSQMLTGVLTPGGEPPPRSAADYEQIFNTSPWLRAALGRISYDVAATDWRLFRPKGGRRRSVQRAYGTERKRLIAKMAAESEMEEVTEHPLLDLLHDYNPNMTGLQARQLGQVHLDSVGESFLMMERNRLGMPGQLWPIPPSWVKSTPTPSKPFFEMRFKGWEGKVPKTEVIWACHPDPANPYGRGTGIARALADEIEADEYAAKMMKSEFFNKARPDLIVSPKGDQSMGDADARRLEEDWNRSNRGFWRSFRAYFVKRAVDVQTLNTSFQSLQFLELREYERNTCLQVFGVSPEIIGIISSGSARATITEARIIYTQNVIIPRLELSRAVLQERLLPEYDDKSLIADYVSPTVMDVDTQLEMAKAAPGGLTVDEWRESMGKPPLPDGKGQVFLVRSNITAYEEISEVSASQPGGDNEGRRDTDRSVRSKAADNGTKAADPDALVTIGQRLMPDYTRALEGSWTLDADVEPLAQALALNDHDAVVDALGGVGAIIDATAVVVEEQAQAHFMRGAEFAHDTLMSGERSPIGVSLSDVNPEATAWAQAHAAELVVDIPETVMDAIRALVVMSNEQGITTAKLARMMLDQNLVFLLPRQIASIARFRQKLTDDGIAGDMLERRVARFTQAQIRSRARTTARTETMRSLNEGQHALWQQAQQRGVFPSGTRRKWILSPEPCPICEDIKATPGQDGVAGEVRIGESFAGGVSSPPAHPNCMCAMGISHVP